jgi:membrane dipeptidase
MKASMICDLHCDTALLWQTGATLQDTSLQVNLPYLREAGVALQIFAAYAPAALPKDRRFSFVERTIKGFMKEIDRYPDQIVLCRNSGEVEAAVRCGKIAALLAVENGDAIEGDLGKLRRLYDLGVRLMTLIHTSSNDWIISSRDTKPSFDGLARFGVEVVKAMNEMGMIIDVSHAHDWAVEKVLQHSRAPIVASHSCMRALCSLPRNISDDLIRLIAAGGGVVGINFAPVFLDCEYRKKAEKRGKEVFAELDRMTAQAGDDAVKIGRAWFRLVKDFRKTMDGNKVSLNKLLEQFDYLVDLAGEDAAAFGSDFDGILDTPEGVEDCRGFVTILQGLRDRDYSQKRLEKICWSNFFRVLKSVCR